MKNAKITKIYAREILDSRGNPTVETTVWAGSLSAKASVPSGASTGIHEALELRDGDKKRYSGKGVLKACKNVNTTIAKKVVGMDAMDQEKIDRVMLALDGTENKSKLGANAILSLSLAAARLAALASGLPLYAYLAKRYGYKATSMPVPLFNVINGGVHAKSSGLDVQEFFLIPQKGSFKERVRKSAEVYHALKKHLDAQKLATGVGDEGGFAPRLGSNEAGFAQLSAAISMAGYKLGPDFQLGTDAAASEFFDAKSGVYDLKASKKKYKSADIAKLYKEWYQKYHLAVIEDGAAEDDIEAWKALTKELAKKAVLVGDDLFVTNTKRLSMGIKEGIANAVLIKVNQIGTLTETMETIKMGQANKYKIVISHRSGETTDDFISDLAVAVNAQYIKTGATSRGERLVKYNRLMEIEEEL